MFGFSYGGQLACAVGRKLGTKLIKEIDSKFKLQKQPIQNLYKFYINYPFR